MMKIFHKNMILVCILIIFSTFDQFNINNSNEILVQKQIESADITYNSKIGNGEEINISIFQQNIITSEILIDPNNLSNNTIELMTPTNIFFNHTFTNITISSIEAENKWYVIEDGPGSPSSRSNSGNLLAASFSVPMSCNLTDVKIRMNITTPGTFRLFIANSTWNPTALRSNVGFYNIKSPINTTSYSSTSGFSLRTFQTVNTYLDVSKTHNNTFFIIMWPESGTYWWQRANPSTFNPANETWSYYNQTIVGTWNFITAPDGVNSSDFLLEVHLSPVSTTPLPSQINLKINNTFVCDLVQDSFSGRWINSNESICSENGKISYSFSCSWPFVLIKTYTITSTFLNRTRSSSIFSMETGSTYIHWNIKKQINNYNSTACNRFGMNYTVNDNWTAINVLRDNVISNDFSVYNRPDLYQDIVFYAPYNIGNNTWILQLTSENIGINIALIKNGQDVRSFFSNDKITPNIECINDIIGTVYLIIWDKNFFNIYNESKIILTNTHQIFFSEWIPERFIQNLGFYYIQIFWNNTKNSALFLETQFEIIDDNVSSDNDEPSDDGNLDDNNSQTTKNNAIYIIIGIIGLSFFAIFFSLKIKRQKSKLI